MALRHFAVDGAGSADLVIVGAGLAGSAVAWAASKRGLRVVVLEAFEPGHGNGSSHGSARIFRRVYADPLYVAMTGQAGDLWHALEDEAGEAFITVTGGVDFGPSRDAEHLYETLTARGVRADLLPAAEARRRWPGFDFTGTGPVLYQPDAGVLDPERAVAAMLRLAASRGARIHFGTPATSVEPTTTGAIVRTDHGTVTAPVAVIAVGAWLAPLMESRVTLPTLTVTQEQILHLPQREGLRLPRQSLAGGGDVPWPAFIYEGEGTCFYGLLGGRDAGVPGGVKIGEHHAGAVTTADTRNFAIDPRKRERILDFASRCLPGLDTGPYLAYLAGLSYSSDNSNRPSEATCLYTTTANEDFILDRQGPFVIASACSGHGAKFAPLLGEIITDLAVGRPSPDPRFTLAAHLAAEATRGGIRRIFR